MATADRQIPFPSVSLAGVRLHRPSEAECVRFIVEESVAGRGGWVVTPNLDILRKCSLSRELTDLVNQADLRVADGMPLIWAGKLKGRPFPERVAGSSMIRTLCAEASGHGRSAFFLGGDAGTAAKAAEILAADHPGLRIAGTSYPEFGFDRDPERMTQIADELRRSRADIVFVALGFPKQERVIRSLRHALPNAWWLGVGISFSFVAEEVHRAPVWIQRLGLEWVHRLAQEPGRLFRRYVLEDVPFAVWFLADAALSRIRSSPD